MRTIFRTLAASLLLVPSGAALCDTLAMKTNSFAEVFNETAKSNQRDKVAKVEKCKSGFSSWCRYRISDRTIVVVTGKAADGPARRLTIITSAKGDSLRALSAEDEAVWPIVIQILNPELLPEQRREIENKLIAAISNDQTITTKIGVNRYSVFADPHTAIWLVVNLKPSTSTLETKWIAKWRKQYDEWIK